MQIIDINDFSSFTNKLQIPVAATIGSFDAIHLGHRKLIQETISVAKQNNLSSALITFSVHPRKIISSDKTGLIVYPMPLRLELIERCGVDIVYIIEFDQKFSEQSANEFIEDFLIKKIGVECLIIGSDFRFGKNRKGTIDDLTCRIGTSFTDVKIIQFEKIDSEDISTTRIRQLISNGNIKKANELLGEPYTISGQVVFGDGRGKVIGVPTANLIPNMEVIPQKGVYASKTIINHKIYNSITNIGTKPTFKQELDVSVETHIFDFDAPLHNNDICIQFFEFIRPEKKFDSTESLVQQIKCDINKAQIILKG